MSGPKPCLGYPTRTAACLALKAEGLSQTQIAKRIGISSNAVASLIAHGRRAGQPRSKPVAAPAPAGRPIDAFTVEERAVLRREAARRDMSADRLVQTIIETAIADNLFAAILDDGGSGR